MSGVVPFLSLLGGAGFLPANFFGVFGFFLFTKISMSSSPVVLDRLGGGGFELGVLAPLSKGVRVRFTCLPEIPRHLSRCWATLVTTKYRGQLGHFTVGKETFSGAICLKDPVAGVDGVDGGLEAGVLELVGCFF